ncbi:5-dehydro-2-deoxygluconokinase [Vibrio nigripulchritudo]|uniref:5-dehydro-2-deoxygluconokinase n=1 Tax=Vibrio nigripulchritudo TaxID=28173 RepID=UPI00190BC295|nr:5-dehydro-2-deoxygluconokinase [Vibrio nigripulchritudo]BCL69285.1 5-dehydro-2-deoxygluconokinase [Vibrio nigripulchritudo]BDU30619.1 5-dehydro-2-deoxygluconokinase [Vibrio nigripulchritudo]
MSSELVLHDWSASHNRPIEAICLGRAGMDLYASDFGATLATTSTYHKAVGGSPANIAFALSKLGAKAAILSCVSKDGVGEFVRKAMEKQGINTDFLFTVSGEHRTSLALAEYDPKPEVVIYRNLAADLALSESHISATDFSQIRALVVSGTALSQSPSRESCYLAMKKAAAEHCKVVLDLDYRAYSWQSAEEAASCYQKAAELSDVIIGNEEEFQVMMASDLHSKDSDAMAGIANQLLAKKPEMIVAKAGEHGCKVFGLDANQSLTSFSQGIFQVEAKKPYGAGDAFAGALLFGLLRGQPLQDSIALGAANAAINVMGNTCSEAMAELPELLAFMKTHRYDFSPQFSLLSHKESCHG